MDDASMALCFTVNGRPVRVCKEDVEEAGALKEPNQVKRMTSAKPLGKAGAMGQVYKLPTGAVAKVSFTIRARLLFQLQVAALHLPTAVLPLDWVSLSAES
jgi:hypothetical protein